MTTDEDDLTAAERWPLAELDVLDEVLDTQQQRLDELYHRVPLGVLWFGDRDDWIDKRVKP